MRSPGCSPVFADQAGDGLCPLNPGSESNRLAGLVQWRLLLPRLMGPVVVVVPHVLGQDLPQVLLAVDQQVIEALAAQCAHEPLCV